MKILFIAHDSLKAGSGCCLYEFLKMVRNVPDITPVILTHSKNNLSEACRNLGLETYSFRYGFTCSWTPNRFLTIIKKFFYRPVFNWLAYHRLKRVVNLKSLDLIHSNSGVIDFGAYLSKKLKIKHIWHFREFGSLNFSFRYVVSCFPAYASKNSSLILCVSKSIENYFRSQGVLNIRTLYDGVVGKDFSVQKRVLKGNERVKICMCGMLSETKGQHLAIEALSKIPDERRKAIQLDFFGEGELREQLQKDVQKYKLENIVHFMGFSSKLKNVLFEYDIGLNLSRVEGFGRTTVEYMLAGLYVIGHDTGATPEILNGGKVGTLIQYGDTEALAKEIINFVENSDSCRELAEKGRRFALENFTIEKNYMNFVGLFRAVVENRQNTGNF